jgi:hypothetical protein
LAVPSFLFAKIIQKLSKNLLTFAKLWCTIKTPKTKRRVYMFEQKLNEWVEKVVIAYNSPGMADTYRMIVDVDKIVAEAFNHAPVIAK